jgi:hypothetical protein
MARRKRSRRESGGADHAAKDDATPDGAAWDIEAARRALVRKLEAFARSDRQRRCTQPACLRRRACAARSGAVQGAGAGGA